MIATGSAASRWIERGHPHGGISSVAYITDLEGQLEVVVRRGRSAQTKRSLRGVFERARAPRKNAPVVVSKNPASSLCLQSIVSCSGIYDLPKSLADHLPSARGKTRVRAE